ncbi:class I adenylate-forming enzyme family protein [Homoserinibacter sp. YIM 151385]|uniref:class I adenylate-forming enzyme family protein n=1 Tax=Homoserinibacter sp. YIM 151385 TaxID=2985506 RepID=UPI0022F0BD93|nr:class I adenylate-forming enzyme family protein [Homoserinibacter sp. YIM 151385]WBU38785.1 class I adenylate-forming enzyme family protein [Homoserinibacter sp. YIM 151385]
MSASAPARSGAHRIAPVELADPLAALPELRRLRATGAVPLVLDPRLAPPHRAEVVAAARAAVPGPDVAWAALTSGSSGRIRLVLRSEASWSASFPTIEALLGARPGDGIHLPLPPASSLTLFSLAHALAGGPQPAPAGDARLLHGTPESLRAVLEDGRMPRLEAALVGGSRLDPELRRRAEARGIRVVHYYGAAELSFVAADEGGGMRALPGVELAVRDGVLRVRSATIAESVLGRGGALRIEDDWADVGDRAELHDGVLRLLGRADEALQSASATVIPEEVEAVLRTLPGVRDAALVGIPHPRLGDHLAAVLELEAGAVPPAASALREAVRGRLSRSHLPRRWHHGEIPRTLAGKPARAELVRRIVAGEVARCA